MSKIAEIEFITKEDSWPLVPEGRYQVQFVKCEKQRFFNGTKLYCLFQITDIGPYSGIKLFKAYNFYDPLPRGAELFKDLALLHGRRLSKRMKLSTELFKNKVFVIQVRTVRMDRKQSPLNECQHYSVIDRIVEVVLGGQR